MEDKKECVNCGREYKLGYPRYQGGKWACCCSLDCWVQFTEGDKGE
ncbi:hypothetical protein [Orenia marismortui]|nr:hypothetical protein [Orenia marismortui]